MPKFLNDIIIQGESSNSSIFHDANDIGTWKLSTKKFYVGSQEANSEAIFFKPDGTKMYILGRSGDDVNEYALSTAWDVTTASFTDTLAASNISGSPASEGSSMSMYMSPDGIYLYIVGDGQDQIIQYTLATAWDVSTASYTREQDLLMADGGDFANPTGLHFKADGTTFWVTSLTEDDIQQYNLSTAWDVSTISVGTNLNISPFFTLNPLENATENYGLGSIDDIAISEDGTKVWLHGSSYDTIHQLTLSVAFNITTATYSGCTTRTTEYQTDAGGLYVNETEGKAFTVAPGGDFVRTYDFGGLLLSNSNQTSLGFKNGVNVFGDFVTSGGINHLQGRTMFSNPVNAYSNFTTYSTSSLTHGNGGTVNILDGTTHSTAGILDVLTNVHWGRNNINQNPYTSGIIHNINLGRPRKGGIINLNIGRRQNGNTVSGDNQGVVNIVSKAQTFTHDGYLTIGQKLQVTGNADLQAFDLGGTVIFNDTFTESSTTDLASHTPDTGAGWTKVLDTGTAQAWNVIGGTGVAQASVTDASDGMIYLCDTLPTTVDYEIKVDFLRRDSGDDTFSIIFKYKDADNFFVLQWSTSYSTYCRLRKKVAGTFTDITNFDYGVFNQTTDNLSSALKVRFIDNQVMVWDIDSSGYQAYRGSYIVSDFTNDGNGGTFHKFGMGIGAIDGGSHDQTTTWKIDKFEVKQLSSAATLAQSTKHYIDAGYFGVGTIDPSEKLHVDGNIRTSGNIVVAGTVDGVDIAALAAANTGDQTLPTASSLGAVTLTGNQTISGAKNFTSASNQFNGHVYFNAYDANGNHYPHFRDGSNSDGANINIRHYYGSNYKTHIMSSDSSGNMQFDFQGTYKGDALDIDGNADISGNLTGLDNVTSTNFIIGGHTINDVDLNGEFVDSSEHLLTSAGAHDRFLRKTTHGQIGDTDVAFGTTTNWANNPEPGFYSTNYNGASGLVFMTGDVGGSASSIGLEFNYQGSIKVHSNTDSNQWHTHSVWTENDFTKSSVLNSNVTLATLGAQAAGSYAAASHNHDDRYYTETESDAKYLLNTTDTLSGSLTVTGNLTVDGTNFGLYHATVNDNYYFDSYDGSKHLATFVKNSRSDIIRYASIDNLEYWNGSSWQDMTSQLANVKKLLDGRQDTNWAVPSTYYKFRFTVSPSTAWPLGTKIGQQLSWSGSQYPGSTMLVEEDANDGNGFQTLVTADFGGTVGGSQTPLNSNNNGISNWGLMFKADNALHTGKGGSQRTRITVDYYGWSPSNNSHVVIPLQNLFITSNYSGTENTDYTNLLDYDRNISIAGNGTFAGTIGSGAITSTGKITGTELEGTSLDINGNGDVSGNISIGGGLITGGDAIIETALMIKRGGGPALSLRREDTSIVNNNVLGEINFTGDDPSATNTGAQIQGLAAGTWNMGSPNVYPSKLVFKTAKEATLLTALTIDDGQDATFAGNLYIPGNIIHVGDTNSYFGFHGNDLWRVVTGGSERLEVSSSGLKLGNTGATVTAILDQDDMSGNSATALATQQSIKAYVDNSVSGAGSGTFLPVAGGTMTGNISMGNGDRLVWNSDDPTGGLSIHSNSSNSFIQHTGTGYFQISNDCTGGVQTEMLITNAARNQAVRFQADNGNPEGTTSCETRDYFFLDGASATYSSGASTAVYTVFPDKSYIALGAGKDLQIYHNGTDSYIDDAGTGDLRIRSNYLKIEKYTGETMATFNDDNAVTLYYNNSAKLATTSSGVSVVGSLSTSSNIDASGTITGKIVRLPNGTTADGGASDNNYYSKIATFSIGSLESNDDVRVILDIVGEESSRSAYAKIGITIRKNAANTTNPGTADLHVLDMMNANDIDSIIDSNCFYLKHGTGTAQTVDLYMQKKSDYGQFNIFEKVKNIEDWSVTYYTNSPWISTLPLTSFSLQSKHTSGTVMTTSAFQTSGQSAGYIPINFVTSPTQSVQYYSKFQPPSGGILERITLKNTTNTSGVVVKVYGGTTASSLLYTSNSLSLTANTPYSINPNARITDTDSIAINVDPGSTNAIRAWQVTCWYKF